jgi:hypothetical protein
MLTHPNMVSIFVSAFDVMSGGEHLGNG